MLIKNEILNLYVTLTCTLAVKDYTIYDIELGNSHHGIKK
jgi:hypothetical protein